MTASAPLTDYTYCAKRPRHGGQRTVNYGYDSIYRLTNETIASDPNNMNGAVSYTYDPVGNRTQKMSTLPGYAGGLTNYNANDQLATDAYDSNGNTTTSQGLGYVYDFENHLIQAGAGITMVYDGDGNRVQKTVAGVTTKYLVDTQSPTGYAQVVYETINGSTAPNSELSHVYSYGLELVNEARSYLVNGQSANSMIYFDYDGHGSVRALTDPNGNVTDTYDYDAFGNVLHTATTQCSTSGRPITTVALGAACPSGSTPAPTLNNYLFAGEQFDPDLGLYYNRARYLNVSTGRFWTMDKLEGDDTDPLSLHKYMYAESDPVDNLDPAGTEIDAVIGGLGVSSTINAATTLNYNPLEHQYRTASTVSFRGIEFIKLEEGLRTMPYNDLGKDLGNCTIGYGHLVHLGVCTDDDYSEYPNGISQDEAEQLLFDDVYQKAVFPIKFLVTVPLAQKEFDALTDFTFNLGAGNSLPSLQAGRGLASTTLLRVLNLGFYPSVPTEFRRFTFSGGVSVPALVRRRNDEANLWVTGLYFANGKLIP